MRTKSSESTLVWAVDPFDSDRATLRSSVQAIRALLAGRPARVYPVFAWTGAAGGTSFPTTPGFFHRLRAQGQDAIDRVLDQAGIEDVAPLEILSGPRDGVREGILALVERARVLGADQIVVSTHARAGLKRVFFGSFAESLALVSDIPLFITRPRLTSPPKLRRILFPTDFSEASEEAFKQLLAFARARGAAIEIFHVSRLPTPVGVDFMNGGLLTYESVLREEERARAETGRVWARRARARGVRAHVVIQRTKANSVADAVLARAKRADYLIALASQSGPVASVLLGSQARAIIRCATRLVWILHPPRSSRAELDAIGLGTGLLDRARARAAAGARGLPA